MLIFGSGYSTVTRNYNAPTLAEMRVKLARALRDQDGNAFTDTDLNDFIAAALVEVSRVYPKELIETFDAINGVWDYEPSCTEIFRVQMLRDDVPGRIVYAGNGEELPNGWDVFGGHLLIPRSISLDENHDAFQVWGYAPRDAAVNDTDILDVDAEAEQAVRTFSQLLGYQSILNNRARFAQWQALPSNTDVSLAQIEAMVQTFEAHWSSERKHIHRLRRV